MAKTAKGERVFSLTAAECDWQYFRVSGAGGQHRDKSSSGVRVKHSASGAVGQATESRSQLANRKVAWRRMIETPAFKVWLTRKLSDLPTPEEVVAREMQPQYLLVEGREDGTWKPIR